MNHLELFHYALAVLRFVHARSRMSTRTARALSGLRRALPRALSVGLLALALSACTPPGGRPADGDGETVRYAVTGFALDPRDTSSSSAANLDDDGPHYDNRVGVTVQFLAQLILRGGTTLASRDDLELAIDPDGATLAGARFPTHQTAPVNARIPLPLFAATDISATNALTNALTIDAYDLRLDLAPNRDHGALCGAIALDDFIAALFDAVAARLAAMPDRPLGPLPFVDEDRDGALSVREIEQLLGGGDLGLEADGAIGFTGADGDARGQNKRPAVSFAIRFDVARRTPPREQPVTLR